MSFFAYITFNRFVMMHHDQRRHALRNIPRHLLTISKVPVGIAPHGVLVVHTETAGIIQYVVRIIRGRYCDRPHSRSKRDCAYSTPKQRLFYARTPFFFNICSPPPPSLPRRSCTSRRFSLLYIRAFAHFTKVLLTFVSRV